MEFKRTDIGRIDSGYVWLDEEQAYQCIFAAKDLKRLDLYLTRQIRERAPRHAGAPLRRTWRRV